MRESLKKTNQHCGLVALMMAFTCTTLWLLGDVSQLKQRNFPNDLARQTNLENDLADSNLDVVDQTSDAPQIWIHIYLIEFRVSSPEAHVILEDYTQRLDAALAEFNSSPALDRGAFIDSEQFREFLQTFESIGNVTICDELPKTIQVSKTANWGESIVIAASPCSRSGDELSVQMSADSARSRIQTTVALRDQQTLLIGGMAGFSDSTAYRNTFVLSAAVILK